MISFEKSLPPARPVAGLAARTATRPAGRAAAAAAVALALVTALLAFPAAAMSNIGAKQFAALADDAFGVLSNPAGLVRMEQRSVLLRVTVPVPKTPGAGSAIERLIAYAEPDSGLGAGALAAHSGPGGLQYMYSVARKFGPDTAMGSSLKYRSAEGMSWWALDFGLQHDFARDATFGLAVLNALSSKSRGAGSSPAEPLPTGAQVGVALGNEKGFFVAADYAVYDLKAGTTSSVASIIAGVELGSALLWGGHRSSGSLSDGALILGLEIHSGALRFSLAAFDVGGPGRTLSFGVAYHF